MFSKPLTLWTGFLVLAFLLMTALYAILSRRGIIKKDFKYHFYLAGITIAMGLLHAALGIAAYFL